MKQLISQDFYQQVIMMAEEFQKQFGTISVLPLAKENAKKFAVKKQGKVLEDFEEQLKFLFYSDVTCCYSSIKDSLDWESPETFSLMAVIARLENYHPSLQYDNLEEQKAALRVKYNGLMQLIYNFSKTRKEKLSFFVPRIIDAKYSDVCNDYMECLGLFTSIVAMADGIVTNEEKAFVQKISGEKLRIKDANELQQWRNKWYEEKKNLEKYGVDQVFLDVALDGYRRCGVNVFDLREYLNIDYHSISKAITKMEELGLISSSGRSLTNIPKAIEQMKQGTYVIPAKKTTGNSSVVNTTKVEHKEPEVKKEKADKESKSAKETETVEDELQSLIGLVPVKQEVRTLSNFIKVQQERAAKGMKTSAVSYHCVFTGNPGTGKTTVARILAKIYKNLGVVSKGHLVETDRAGLVAEYVGQTAVKTNKIIDSALDGVLFIDEAYSLIGGGESDYGKEAIATLLKRMEDNRDRLIVILAGYTKNMKDFIDSNPGLQSRFNRYIEFPDYSADELLQIFEANMKKYEYHFGEGAKEYLQQYFSNEVANKDANFGNGRLVRNVFEKTLERQANRLAKENDLSEERLSELIIEDLPN